MININEAIAKIKQVGSKNVRIVPMAGQTITHGLHKIEVQTGSVWVGIVENLPKSAAESIVNQAVNKVILG